MKVNLNLQKGYCEIIKEIGDKKYNRGGYTQPESTFLYHVLNELKKQGFDLIKKRMWKDGHMVDDTQQYIRTRKLGKGEFFIYNRGYNIEDMGDVFNQLKLGQTAYLTVIR